MHTNIQKAERSRSPENPIDSWTNPKFELACGACRACRALRRDMGSEDETKFAQAAYRLLGMRNWDGVALTPSEIHFMNAHGGDNWRQWRERALTLLRAQQAEEKARKEAPRTALVSFKPSSLEGETLEGHVPEPQTLVEPCRYCGMPADSVDHVVPRVLLKQLEALGDDEVTRVLFRRHRLTQVPSCRECNSLLGSKYFLTFEERKAFIKERLRKRYRHALAAPTWTLDELAGLEGHLQDYVIEQVRQSIVIRRRIAW